MKHLKLYEDIDSFNEEEWDEEEINGDIYIFGYEDKIHCGRIKNGYWSLLDESNEFLVSIIRKLTNKEIKDIKSNKKNIVIGYDGKTIKYSELPDNVIFVDNSISKKLLRNPIY